MLRKIIIFLIRKKLGLKKGEAFRFINPKMSSDCYFMFSDDQLLKVVRVATGNNIVHRAHVNLNWILDDSCEIKKIDVEGD